MSAMIQHAKTLTFGQGSGDQKFIPNVSAATVSKLVGSLLGEDVKAAITAIPPFSLGFPGKHAQSTYYPGLNALQRDEIATISRVMEQHNILPENTRIRKDQSQTGRDFYTVLQASTHKASRPEAVSGDMKIFLEQGDHGHELASICTELRQASKYAANETQRRTIELYVESFETGNLEIYRDALRSWVRDLALKVEHIIGFVEPYRDPYGIRAEFEGLVAIADPKETYFLQKLVDHSDSFISKLPWCTGYEENNGKGPFEKSLFEPPNFSSIHGECIEREGTAY